MFIYNLEISRYFKLTLLLFYKGSDVLLTLAEIISLSSLVSRFNGVYKAITTSWYQFMIPIENKQNILKIPKKWNRSDTNYKFT